MTVVMEKQSAVGQQKFDFSTPRPRPFISNLPGKIDSYEEEQARFFRWRTGLEYYATIDQIVDFVINTGRTKVVDLLSDTATFALRLASRKAFYGRIQSFDDNITLLERARQRARHLNLEGIVEFQKLEVPRLPLPDDSTEIAVSIFDLHRHSAEQFLTEAIRILVPQGYLLIAEVLEPRSKQGALAWTWKKLHLRYVKKNIVEAESIYYDREQMINMLFMAGFRQVVIQGLKSPRSDREGIFSLIAATK